MRRVHKTFAYRMDYAVEISGLRNDRVLRFSSRANGDCGRRRANTAWPGQKIAFASFGGSPLFKHLESKQDIGFFPRQIIMLRQSVLLR
jgi:hypothetical protein